MGLRIGNNPSLNLQRNLLATDVGLQRTLLQLATGLRIRSAADGPAALAISEQLRAGIAGQTALIENTTRAVNLVQTADGALTEVSNQLVELRGLAIEAANTGVNDANALAAIQSQIEAGIQAIRNTTENTQFGTRRLLNGDLENTQFQITEGAPVALSIPDLRPENLGVGVDTVSGVASLAAIDVTTVQGATDALAVIDAAAAEITSVRADLGAFQQNVLESNVTSLRIARENLLQSESTIRDANIAEVVGRISILQTLLQAGISTQGVAQDQRAGLLLDLLV